MTRDELQRLINLIVQELSAVQSVRSARCTCHSVNLECCPTRLQGVIVVKLGERTWDAPAT